jgi:hypothetical protein
MPSPTCPIDPEEEAFNRGREEDRERRDSARPAFEHLAVVHVLKGLGRAYARGWLSGQARDLTGDPAISFALLHHLVPDFPIRLGVARLYYLRENLTLDRLFRRPQASPVYRAFREWAEEDVADDDRPRGIIFRLPGCPGNGSRAILHTYPVPVEVPQTRVTFGIEERRVVAFYTLEPLDQLLGTLQRIYRPSE